MAVHEQGPDGDFFLYHFYYILFSQKSWIGLNDKLNTAESLAEVSKVLIE